MSQAKVAKKGEFLIKEGDKIASLILVQSGGASVCLNRNKKNIDIFPIGSSQVLGELALAGVGVHPFSIYATTETKYMEFPLDAAKAQVESAPQFLKLLIKSLIDRLKVSSNEIKKQKMEKDSSPCPEDQVAKIFGTIYHAANHKADKDEKDPQRRTIDWVMMKQYGQRIFTESPRRLEQAVNVLVKMKMATYIMGKPIDDPEGPDEIHKVTFFDLSTIEAFFEFYQYHYFKGGKGDILKPDATSYNLLDHFLKLGETVPADRFGVVTLDYAKVLESFKDDLNLVLNNGHFTILEGRGVFAKRATRADGSVAFQFEIREWQTTLKIWKILKEIEKWNEKGFVDINEEEAKKKKSGSETKCPQCQAEAIATAKFCGECGYKLIAEKAA